ncbi:tRNA (adenosine(37)-N6)-threonylcarbamoyltransferase complex dimerization subunit type 1 TsaB [Saccharibacillus endophyticus]|uniref:tRNA (Adenosine(37)-N6)-threonylcarbamoyltransferase complex dimerization subunit type 1 TsaB n=1 Tax=Saccharibacillus endophyticus TaxID=2060666 RepID=A0ABQ1ZRX2_9BACL|nr:tRNA (adenosine(37)-N6)-threonylcarbamoyltransferase complex dimerization subunit type 1 TsaB [Saccharibacillus endophyticus]GGH76039.1 tRNA (adenosine(37)-N6)-threonylcarbamoyltransferase complex dimerization subunit type 1 TsaB [Saccharibacillus endophyticus]
MEKHNRPQGRILALDTSSAAQAVAVLDGADVLVESNNLAERNHSVNLLPEIERVLHESGTNKRELNGIAVGVGPGSYTGVRIAVTTAKTLAWALKLPVAAVSSLEAQAASGFETAVLRGRTWIIPLVDARRGQAYTALFEANVPGEKESVSDASLSDFSLHRLAEDAILLTGEWTAKLAERFKALAPSERPDHILFTGETVKHAETVLAIAELTGLSSEQVRLQDCVTEARWIGRIGQRKLAAGDTAEAHSLLPNYTQVTEAEANLLRNPQ